MVHRIELGDISIDVVLKNIKNIHLSVYPPNGKVRIAAPERMDMDTIRVYAISKLGWIKEQQRKFQEQDRETPREYLNRETHFLWGKRYLLKVVEIEATPTIELNHSRMVMNVRPGADEQKKEAVLEQWYRKQIKTAVWPLIEHWEKRLGVKVERVFIQRMKTRWGSCNHQKGHIRLNTELAKKPRECLEYIVVHEMAHLLEPTHNARFVALMDQYMPQWKAIRDELNRAPLGHVTWEY